MTQNARWLLLFGSLLACSTQTPVECHFGADTPVADTLHAFDRLRIVERDLLWSAPDGLWHRPLDGGASTRLGERCAGGFDAKQRDDVLVVACSRPPTDKHPAGQLVWLEFSDQTLVRRIPVGPVGRDSRGVGIERVDTDAWWISWHDGTPGHWSVWTARISSEGATEPALASSPQTAAGSPTTWSEAAGTFTLWSESWLDAGFPTGQIMVWPGSGAPQRVTEVEVLDARPIVMRDERSRILFFRDLRRPFRRVGLYAVRLDDRFGMMGEPERIGRANAEGPIQVLPCAGSISVITPRTWDEDLLIAINLLDTDLQKRVAEQQVYEWNAHFGQATTTCIDDTLHIVVGEEGRGLEQNVRAHAITLRCE